MKKSIFALSISLLFVMGLVGCSSVESFKDLIDEKKSSIEDNTENNLKPVVEERAARLYFFDTTKSELTYINKKIEVTNNNLVQALNEELQNNTDNKNFVTMSKEAELDSVKIDNNTGVLTVKFKNNFFSKMDIGDISESGFYSALITTYAYNYGLDKVALYQANELYTGMRGELPEGFNEVSFSGIKEFVKADNAVNNTVAKNCRIFYYTAVDDKIYYVDKKVEIIDKAVIKALTNALKTAPNETFYSLAQDVDVTKANIDTDKGILTVDLSPTYYNILSKVGSGSEAGVLRSLALTYGNYYGLDKVIIKVDGKNYAGGHIAYEDGEFIKVDTSEITKYNN